MSELLSRDKALELIRQRGAHYWYHSADMYAEPITCHYCNTFLLDKLHANEVCLERLANAFEDVRDQTIDWVASELREGWPMRLRVEAEKVRREK